MDQFNPPEFFLRFFKWFCHPDLHPFIEGDLLELHSERIEKLGKKKADRRFAWDVLLLFRPSIIRSFKVIENLINKHYMFKSYFKIGFRNLNKHRFFSAINIAGMTIGLTCFILIGLYIQYEFSYDRQHEKAEQIYRVSQVQPGNNFKGTDRFALAPMPLAPTLQERFPEVEAASTLQIHEALFSHEETISHAKGLFADEHLFDIFTYPVVTGISVAALKDPNAIILTESMAKKHFGNEPAIGQTLLFDNDRPLTVKGVIEDVPANQHFSFEYITSFQNYPYYKNNRGNWNSNNYRAYIALAAGTDPEEFESKLALDNLYFEFTDIEESRVPILFLQALTDIHLHSHINFELGANGDIRYIYFSASIALIILLLASINYMNLTTARSSQRAKEVGVRKVLGAKKGQVVSQFMAESILISLFSFGLAVGLAYLLLPAFNQLLDQSVSFNTGSNSIILIGILLLALLLGVSSGLYPALLSSSTNSINALKGSLFKHQKDSAFLSNVLVIGQFTVAIALAISSVIIYQQVSYIQNKKLGYNREQIVYVPYQRQAVFDKISTIRDELQKHPQIDQVSLPTYLPLNMGSQGTIDNWQGNNEQEQLWIYRNYVDYEFIDLFEIELLEGRNFSPEYATDSTASCLLNEAAIKALGWDSAVGKDFDGKQVIGVVKDFHFQPFDLAIEPLYISFHGEQNTDYRGNIAIKVNVDHPESAITHFKETVTRILPELPFDHRFLNESYNQLYQTEKRFGQAFNIFTIIALFIACMGLFGLVTHKVMQRTKEIGIRKVLGASVHNIVGLVSKDFIRLVVISAIIAIPIAWFGMDKWLQDFAYRIDLQWWVFAVVGLLAIGLAFFTVSAQSIKAAIANPVDALKSE